MVTQVMGMVRRRVRKNPLVWRYWLNPRPTIAYRRRGQRPDGEAARILADLNAKGVATTTAETLFGGTAEYEELAGAVADLESNKASEIARARANATSESIGEKTFLLELLGSKPRLDPTGVFARFALNGPLLSIANGYFNMCTRLR